MRAVKQQWNEKKMDSKKRLVENKNKYDFMRAHKSMAKNRHIWTSEPKLAALLTMRKQKNEEKRKLATKKNNV